MNVTYRQGPVSTRGSVRSTRLRVTPIAGDPATGVPPGVTVEGDLDFRGRSRSPDCSGSYRGAFPVDAATNASATIAGEGEDRRLVVSLRLADPSAQLTAQVRCSGGGVSLPIPLGRMLPQDRRGASARGRDRDHAGQRVRSTLESHVHVAGRPTFLTRRGLAWKWTRCSGPASSRTAPRHRPARARAAHAGPARRRAAQGTERHDRLPDALPVPDGPHARPPQQRGPRGVAHLVGAWDARRAAADRWLRQRSQVGWRRTLRLEPHAPRGSSVTLVSRTRSRWERAQ